MEQSRRAVESYWRSKMVEGATSDEDKVTPVYKLEEICDLLRSSHSSIVKEVSEFILKRLDHKSPIVKQKALRVIKYAVGKSGAEFRREMQRNSVAVRQLIHYKGQPDPLKGDALNKAVRETAQETLSALFSSDESKAAPTESSLGSRIQGFGNTNYEMPSEDKKSFISGALEIGVNISGSEAETSSRDSGPTYGQKTREEKLLETIVTSGGVRLQPTRDALNVFLAEASKLNALSLGHAIETKLKAPMWQVRMKAICVLEAVLRRKDDEHLSVISSYFSDNRDVVVQCSESPQASLREKANKVLSLLGGEQSGGGLNHVEKPVKTPQPSIMPDLIDTGDSDDLLGAEDSKKSRE
ncbi:UNVERIFIED_CONTAM: protein MODIFIED TRANSPORT TO THE VACUOLE 1 [Sesamum radiatum]|uniref:Protein MODIFIED TRANSPORT TO THE VACUOLE 1 n=1 Tax=Sesamum radiatum TaxID=300843 RepID=A0AAW2RFH9_SESRA